jgi:hypothetical protein
VGRRRREMDEQNTEILHGTSPHHPPVAVLCGTWMFERVTNVATSIVNFIRYHGLNHFQFQAFFLSDVGAEFADVLCIKTSDG